MDPLLVALFLTVACIGPRASAQYPAEIVSKDGTHPLEFAVGSNITLQCRLNLSLAHMYDVENMTFFSYVREGFDVSVAGRGVIEMTLRGVTQTSYEAVYCMAGSHPVGLGSFCLGYAPSDNMSLSCRLYPTHRMQCCVHTDQPLTDFCDVTWTMSYVIKGMTTEHSSETVDRDTLCGEWAYAKGKMPPSHRPITVRVRAANQIGSTNATLSFLPVKQVVPGKARDLRLLNTTDPHTLLVTWRHDDVMRNDVCTEMGGLSYLLVLTNQRTGHSENMTTQADCGNLWQEQEYRVSDLDPFTPYSVTVTPFSPFFSGPTIGAESMTSQSRPLKAPGVVGWSASKERPGSVAVFWTKLLPPDRGGPIIAYDVSVDNHSVFAELRGEGQGCEPECDLVTFPGVLDGCLLGCEVKVRAFTEVGPSPPAELTIPPLTHDDALPTIHVSDGENGSRSASWDGSANVTSVLWCFGPPFKGHNSIAHCQTEVQEMAVGPGAGRVVVEEAALWAAGGGQEEWPEMCEHCHWHFALGMASGRSHGRRIVWNRAPQAALLLDDSDGGVVAVTAGFVVVVVVSFCSGVVWWCYRQFKRASKKLKSPTKKKSRKLCDYRENDLYSPLPYYEKGDLAGSAGVKDAKAGWGLRDSAIGDSADTVARSASLSRTPPDEVIDMENHRLLTSTAAMTLTRPESGYLDMSRSGQGDEYGPTSPDAGGERCGLRRSAPQQCPCDSGPLPARRADEVSDYVRQIKDPADEVSDYVRQTKDHTDEVSDYVHQTKDPTDEVSDYVRQTKDPADEVSDYVRQTKDHTDEVSDYVHQTKDPTDEVSNYVRQIKDPADEVSDYVRQTKDHTDEVSDYVHQTKDPTDEVSDYVRQTKDPTDEVSDYVRQTKDHTDEVFDYVRQTKDPADESAYVGPSDPVVSRLSDEALSITGSTLDRQAWDRNARAGRPSPALGPHGAMTVDGRLQEEGLEPCPSQRLVRQTAVSLGSSSEGYSSTDDGSDGSLTEQEVAFILSRPRPRPSSASQSGQPKLQPLASQEECCLKTLADPPVLGLSRAQNDYVTFSSVPAYSKISSSSMGVYIPDPESKSTGTVHEKNNNFPNNKTGLFSVCPTNSKATLHPVYLPRCEDTDLSGCPPPVESKTSLHEVYVKQ